jgi:ABC-type Na+ efflux pump permease subunit
MKKIATIAIREFLETVKTKAFLIGVVFMPGLIIGIIFISQSLGKAAQAEKMPVRKLALVDHGGQITPHFQTQITEHNRRFPAQPFELVAIDAPEFDEAALRERLIRQELFAYLVVPTAAVEAPFGQEPECRFGRRDNSLTAGRSVETFLEQALFMTRCAARGYDPAEIIGLRRSPRIVTIDARSGGQSADDTMARVMTPFAFMFLLYFGTFGISMGLLTSVLEEKSTRVVEVLLAAVSPAQLMTGKILGMAAVGLLTLGIWMAVGMSGARAYDFGHFVSGARLAYVGLYFVPSFLFMSALLAGIGSTCNTLKEAQSLVSPLSIMTIIPMMLWFNIMDQPHSWLSFILSFIPPITPFVMILRLCADPDLPVWQVVATLVLMWVLVFFTIWAASKVFRVGILMYGKPPTFKELARWLRYA